jgi:hypothetical protein
MLITIGRRSNAFARPTAPVAIASLAAMTGAG